MGVLNFLSRLSFIAVFSRRSMPPLLARALKYVPAAMLTALVLPMILEIPGGGLAWWSGKVLAAVVAGVVAWVSRSVLKTLVAGMAVLWLAGWLGL